MEHDFIFGVFDKGKLIFALKREVCNHVKASATVALYNLAKDELDEGHYFACDYTSNVFR